jgi:hypothetical protein
VRPRKRLTTVSIRAQGQTSHTQKDGANAAITQNFYMLNQVRLTSTIWHRLGL